jgi:release factor glutamine methyltransferase
VAHDPRTALDGGPDGLDLIRELAVQAVHALEPGGLLALETGIDQATATTAWLATQNYRDITIERDYQGVQRFVFARHG